MSLHHASVLAFAFALQVSKAPDAQVVVQGIPWKYTWKELRPMFDECGTIDRAEVVYGRDGRSRVSLAICISCKSSSATFCGPPIWLFAGVTPALADMSVGKALFAVTMLCVQGPSNSCWNVDCLLLAYHQVSDTLW